MAVIRESSAGGGSARAAHRQAAASSIGVRGPEDGRSGPASARAVIALAGACRMRWPNPDVWAHTGARLAPVWDTPSQRPESLVIPDHDMARNSWYRDGAATASFITYIA